MKRLSLLLLCLAWLAIGAQAQQCHPAENTAVISVSGSGDSTIIAANGNKQIYVWQFFVVNSDAANDTNITLKDGSTSRSGAYLLVHNGGSHTAPCTGTPWMVTSAGSGFVINSSAASTLRGEVYYSIQ